MERRIVVERTGRVLARRVRWASSSQGRRRGLLDVPALGDGEALVIPGAFQVHSVGMTYAIDVVFCSRRWVVKRVVRNMVPGRLSRPVLARYAIELASGGAGDVRPGDKLIVTDQDPSER